MPRKTAATPAPATTRRGPAKAASSAVSKVAGKVAAKVASKSASKVASKVAAKALLAPAARKPAARKPVARKSVARPAPAPLRAPAQDARPLLVRDSFTMPEHEYAVLDDVKQACLRAGIDVKKSELLRIGVALLGQLDMGTLRAVLAALPQLKTGRPPAKDQ